MRRVHGADRHLYDVSVVWHELGGLFVRPAYFVVSRELGRETPIIYWDELPKAPIRNLVYVQRLDQFPNGADLVRAPLANLFAVYQLLKKRGKLPPQWQPPPRPKEDTAAKVREGHREVHARRYLPDAPYEKEAPPAHETGQV